MQPGRGGATRSSTMLVLAVLLAGCSSLEYQATLTWQDEGHVQKILDAATAAGQVCPLGLLGHDMVPERLSRVVIGVCLLSGLAFLAFASTAVFTAARDTYRDDKHRKTTD